MIVTKNLFLILLLLGNLISRPFDFALAQDQNKTNLSRKDLPICKKVGRKTPPIWVTVTGFDTERDRDYKNYQNYNEGRLGEKGSEPMIVPKRSIVRLEPGFQSLVEKRGDLERNADKWVPVRVVSVPPVNTKLREAVSGNVASVAKHKFRESAKVGTVGRIRLGDLEKVESQNDYVFAVKRDSPLFRALHDPNNPNAAASEVFTLELHKVDGLYQVNHCCDESGKVCRDFHIFKAQNVKNKKGQDLFIRADCEQCWLGSVVPIQKDFTLPLKNILTHPSLGLDTASPYAKLMSIGNLNFVDARGMVQIPVKDIEGDRSGQLGPYGSYRYSPDGVVRKGNPEIYMKPEAACGLMQVFKTWNEKYCPGSAPHCRIEFGDASHAYSKYFNDHKDHDNGDCIDIRPMNKKSKGTGPKDFNISSSNNKDFEKFMGLLHQLDPSYCIVGDRALHNKFDCLGRKGNPSAPFPGHENHLHICIPRVKVNAKGEAVPNYKLLKACQEGVK